MKLLTLALVTTTLMMPPALLAEFRTWTKTSGEKVEAELAGETKAAVKLKTKTGSVEIWAKDRLSDEDRQFIGLEGSSPSYADTAPGTNPPSSSGTAGGASPATAGPVSELSRQFTGKLITFKNGVPAPVPASQTAPVKYYAFYYSAKWCPPCRKFTPELVEAYKKLKAEHPEFELIFVSSDESPDAMLDYMKSYKMEWPALRFSDIQSNAVVNRYQARGIPNLVFTDGTGKVLSASYDGGNYVGPRKVLADIQKKFN